MLNFFRYAMDNQEQKHHRRTPAGMHRSICVEEILEFLQITPGQIGSDATLGYGGRARSAKLRWAIKA